MEETLSYIYENEVDYTTHRVTYDPKTGKKIKDETLTEKECRELRRQDAARRAEGK